MRTIPVFILTALVLLAPPRPAAAQSASSPSFRPVVAVECERAIGGNAEAAYRMARRSLYGLGLPRDLRAAVGWLKLAARKGHAESIRLIRLAPRSLKPAPVSCRRDVDPGRPLPRVPESTRKLAERLSKEHRLDPALVLAVIQVESAFQVDAVSPKDAAGLMQLIPETARRFDVGDVFDPEDNIRGGVRYLGWLLSYFRGDVTLALAGYNAGEGAVDRHRGVPPYRETQHYLAAIRRLYGETRHPFDSALAAPSPIVTATR